MTLTVIRGGEYARFMSDLPSPTRSLTLREIEEQHERVYRELEHGGAIRVYTNDSDMLLGVLTRDPRLFDAADIAQLQESGLIPPLDELVAMQDRADQA
jgi:hypothetical protein